MINPIVILGIAVGLAMDTVAVSISCALALKRPRFRDALRIGGSFGLFQTVMPVIGWLAGLGFRNLISGVDHWIALGLLGFIGCRMIYESRHITEKKICPTRPGILLMLSIATSIDALAVGLSFSLLKMNIIIPVLIIGAVTFLMSVIAFMLGRHIGVLFEKKVEMAGGLILIFIGIKILLEHLGIWT